MPFQSSFGDNIGTTITAVLAALGSNIAAKRVAGAHVLFNVIWDGLVFDSLGSIHSLDSMV